MGTWRGDLFKCYGIRLWMEILFEIFNQCRRGPTDNWLTDYSDNMVVYYGMGNHNDLGGRPATRHLLYMTEVEMVMMVSTSGSMTAPNRNWHI